MKAKNRLIFNFSAALIILFSGIATAASSAKNPNVLFIAIDDLKPLLGCYDVAWIKSPAIDHLAARGTVFTANYCQVALCAPTRASLLTGLRPDSTGVYFNPFKIKNVVRLHLPDAVTLPQYFKNHGYVTCAIGKVFDGRTVDEGHDAVSWSEPFIARHQFAAIGPGIRGYQNPETKRRLTEAMHDHSDIWEPGPPVECSDVPDDAYFDGAMARTAVKEIEKLAGQSKPFFLAVGFHKPHLPFIAPKKYWDLYDRDALVLAANQKPPLGSPPQAQVIPNSGELRDYAGVPKTGPVPESMQHELIHGYAACVSYIDNQVALLLDSLEKAGVAENTIICVWGDNGWHLGEHGHWGKSTNYEDATRVPLIIYAPGFGGGVHATSLTELLDIYPTLCDLAGLPTPAHVDGKSLVPVMHDSGAQLHEAAVSQCSTVDSQMSPQLVGGKIDENGTIDSSMGWTLRTPRYRYTEWREAKLTGNQKVFGVRRLGVELYDYEKDPLERVNLADNPEYKGILEEHQKLFDHLLPYLPKAVR